MEFLLGIRFKDFVLLASDTGTGRSIVVMKQDQDKMKKLGDEVGMLICGAPGDCISFGEFIQKNIQLYRIRHGYAMSPHAAANWTRNELAYYLRRSPFQVDMVIGGYDTATKQSKLYFMDHLASLIDVPFAAHGYSSFLIMSILDRFHREDMSKEEAVELLVRCLAELKKRLIVNFPAFSYYFIDENGFSAKVVITPEEVKVQMEGLKGGSSNMETV